MRSRRSSPATAAPKLDPDDEQHRMAERVCRAAGKEDPYLDDLRNHDLRHTVGMRLREANVRESTVADILWHDHPALPGTAR